MGVNIESLGEDWRRARIIRREPRLIRGFWLEIAAAVEAGAVTEAMLASRLRRSDQDVSRAVYFMLKHGHLTRDRGRLDVSKRVHRQLVMERSL